MEKDLQDKLANNFSDVGLHPGQAFWQLGIMERVIQTLKKIAIQLYRNLPELSFKAILWAQVVDSYTEMERSHGLALVQWAQGCLPKRESNFQFEGNESIGLTGEEFFYKQAAMLDLAHKSFTDAKTTERFHKAERARTCRDTCFRPGDAVMIWRSGKGPHGESARTPGQVQDHETKGRGRMNGEAHVLATDIVLDEHRKAPRNVVWVVCGSYLLRCAPQPLQFACARQKMLLGIDAPRKLPWIIDTATRRLQSGTYLDISEDVPRKDDPVVDESLPLVGPPSSLAPPSLSGVAPKAPSSSSDTPVAISSARLPPILSSARSRSPASNEQRGGSSGSTASPNRTPLSQAGQVPTEVDRIEERLRRTRLRCSYSTLKASSPMAGCSQCFEIDFGCTSTRKQQQELYLLPKSSVASQIRRQRAGISERHLTEKQLIELKVAMDREMDKYIRNHMIERIVYENEIPVSQLMKMRWVITLKEFPDGNTKVKARLYLPGFQDSSLEDDAQNCATPTSSWRARLAFLSSCISQSFRIQKADVTATFWPGDELEETKHCIPVPELCRAFDIPSGTPAKVKKGIYGLLKWPKLGVEHVMERFRQDGGSKITFARAP